MAPQGNIEALNTHSLTEFRAKFWQPDARFMPASHAPDDVPWHLDLWTSSTIYDWDLDCAFKLIRWTSSKQYAASSLGWHPCKKKREMRLLDLKYILAKKDWGGSYNPCEKLDGFLSFMLTYEDGIEVIYCYEIHLDESIKGKGLGKCLMKNMEDVGRKAGVKKAMLTVFEANKGARAFYKRLGYEVDDFSPPPKKLRGGVVKPSDYVVLSKSLDNDCDSARVEYPALECEIGDLQNGNAMLKDESERRRLEEIRELQDENARLDEEIKSKELKRNGLHARLKIDNRTRTKEICRLQDEVTRLEDEYSRKRKVG